MAKANLPPLIPIKPDPDETPEGAPDIKTEDNESSDPLDVGGNSSLLSMKTNENSDSECTELVEDDYPIIKLPTTLSKAELYGIFKKKKLRIPNYLYEVQDLATELVKLLKRYHPLWQRLFSTPMRALQQIHRVLLGQVPDHQIHMKTTVETNIARYYFKWHRKSPLSSFLQDRRRFVLQKTDQIIKIDACESGHSIAEEIDVKDEFSKHMFEESSRSETPEVENGVTSSTIKPDPDIPVDPLGNHIHPIHQIIEHMRPEEVRAYITLSGDNSVEDQNPRDQFEKICFRAKPEAPIEYYYSLQCKFKKIFPNGFPRPSKKRKNKWYQETKNRNKIIKSDTKIEKPDHPIHQFIEHMKPEEVEACIWYSGDQSMECQNSYVKLANICLGTEPETPLQYLIHLQIKYKNVGVVEHRKVMKKFRAIFSEQKNMSTKNCSASAYNTRLMKDVNHELKYKSATVAVKDVNHQIIKPHPDNPSKNTFIYDGVEYSELPKFLKQARICLPRISDSDI